MSNRIEEYYDGMEEIIKDSGNPDVFKISPSSIEDFFTKTSQYYREQVLKQEKSFLGSTSTVLGTIIHKIVEDTINNKSSITQKEIIDYIDSIKNIDINKNEILTNYENMSSILIDKGVLPRKNSIHTTEKFIYKKLNDDVYVGGTLDAICKDPINPNSNRIIDWKTASSKPNGFSWKYTLQAYSYAWILREKGIPVSSVELSFIIKPTKTLPARYFQFVKPYNDEAHETIGSILNLIAESVSKFKYNPELRHLLAQDNRLRERIKIPFPTK